MPDIGEIVMGQDQARVTQLEAELVLVQALMNRGVRNPPESFTRGA